jgi:hypothetical protein
MANKSKERGFKSEGPSRVVQRVLRPTHLDVIFGKGKPFQMHSGNRRMRRIASVHKRQYLESKHDKVLIADMVLQRIKNSGSEPVRFLKRGDEELWVEVGDCEARKKVMHVLRSTKTETKNPEPSDEVNEQDTASASLPVNQPSMPRVETPPMIVSSSSSNIPRHSLDSLRGNEALLSATFLPAAALVHGGPVLRMHGLLSHIAGVRSLVAGYPTMPPPTMMSGIPPFGMVGAPHVVAPRRHFDTTPVGLLTDAQILEALIQRTQGRADVRGRPQFP